ncbi:MAG: hypothetical protein ABFS45_00330 [Pseudomonadota bacterium]
MRSIHQPTRPGLAASLSILMFFIPTLGYTSDALSFTPEVGVRYDNNVGLAPKSADKVEDFVTRVGGKVQYTAFGSPTNKFVLGGGVRYDHFFDLTDLSNLAVSASALYRGQFGPEPTSVWYSLKGEITGLYFKESEIRDGYKTAITATLGKRLSDNFAVSAGYQYQLRRSTNDDPEQTPPVNPSWNPDEVFDLDRQGVFTHLDFMPTTTMTLYGEYSYFTGDVAATGRSFNQGATFTRARDMAFGPGFIVWRIDADVHTGRLGIKYKINEQAHLNLYGQYLKALGESDNDYEGTVVNASANYRF